jgi:hypothetical protein
METSSNGALFPMCRLTFDRVPTGPDFTFPSTTATDVGVRTSSVGPSVQSSGRATMPQRPRESRPLCSRLLSFSIAVQQHGSRELLTDEEQSRNSNHEAAMWRWSHAATPTPQPWGTAQSTRGISCPTTRCATQAMIGTSDADVIVACPAAQPFLHTLGCTVLQGSQYW